MDENLFILKLGSKYFNAIKNGEKTMEGRILDQKRKDIIQCYNNSNGNVYIKFICADTNNVMTLKLKGYIVYPSFLEATKLHYKEMIPLANTPEEAALVYRQWFTKEDEEQYEIVLLLV